MNTTPVHYRNMLTPSDRTSTEIIAYARKAMWSLQASVSVHKRTHLYKGKSVEVIIPESSRFGFQIDPYGITLSCQPGILGSTRLAPAVRVQQLRYTFATGAFHVDASGDRTNLFGLVGSVTANKIEFRLHEFFGPLLPKAMRKPGYTPATDENLVEHLLSLIEVLKKSVELPLTDGRLGRVAPTVAKNLHIYLHLVSPENLQIPIARLGMEIFCPVGASVFVSAQTTGNLDAPQIQSLKLSSSPGSLVIRANRSELEVNASVDLQQLHVLPGGQIRFEYELGLDEIAALPDEILRFLGLQNVDFRLAKAEDILQIVRGALDFALEQEAPTRLRAFLLHIAPLLPGIDATRIFGLEQPPPT